MSSHGWFRCPLQAAAAEAHDPAYSSPPAERPQPFISRFRAVPVSPGHAHYTPTPSEIAIPGAADNDTSLPVMMALSPNSER